MRSSRIAASILASAMAMSSVSFPAAQAADHAVEFGYADSFGDVLSGSEYTIMVRLSGKYVTARPDGNAEQWEKASDGSQNWIITDCGNGKCSIMSSLYKGMALTVESGDSTDGSNVSLSEYRDAPSQHFILHRTDDAYYITAECSGNAALDVYDISRENGANIDQWDYWAGEGQKFYIRPVDSSYRFLRGDLDSDGKVDMFDRVLMERGLTGGFDEGASAAADMDGNGTVDYSDYSLLSSFLAGGNINADTYSELPYEKPDTAYLFAYFLGNAPEQERLSYAVSTDGYHFKALNNGKAVWKSNAGTECIRDPYIFKGEDGMYYMLATDMKSSLGWSSNRNLITARSTDLVHWFDDTIIEIANKYPNMQGADRA